MTDDQTKLELALTALARRVAVLEKHMLPKPGCPDRSNDRLEAAQLARRLGASDDKAGQTLVAHALHAAGWSYDRIGAAWECSGETVRRLLL